MTMHTALILLGFCLLGAFMVVLGIRGRRINRVPACRQCDFDLSKLLPEGVTCPECGAGLKRPKSIREGQRRRLWITMALGAVLLLAPGSLLGFVGLLKITNSNVDSYKPWALVLWEAKTGNVEMVEAAATEIERRDMLGLLTRQQYDEAVAAALELQARPDRPWSVKLGNLIEQARLRRTLDDDDYDRFLNRVVPLTADTRPQVRSGGLVPVIFWADQVRCGESTFMDGSMALIGATIDGRDLEVHSTQGWVMEDTGSLARTGVQIGNFLAYYRQGVRPTRDIASGSVVLRLPSDLKVGGQTLTLKLRLRSDVRRQALGGVAFAGSTAPRDIVKFDRIFDVPVEIAQDGDGIKHILPTDELDAQMRAGVRITLADDWRTYLVDAPHSLRVQFEFSGLPYPIAHEVYLRTTDGEILLGTVDSDPEGLAQNAWAFSGVAPLTVPGSVTRTLMRTLPVLPREFDLVLRPSTEVAESTMSLRQVYDGEMVFENLRR